MQKLDTMPNIGADTLALLQAAGIHTPEQLRQMGAKKVWLALQSIDESACYNRLCGLQGAIENIRWHHLSPAVKADLKAFYSRHKK